MLFRGITVETVSDGNGVLWCGGAKDKFPGLVHVDEEMVIITPLCEVCDCVMIFLTRLAVIE